MDQTGLSTSAAIYKCKCESCDHDFRSLCIEGQCKCCDLEDVFAVLSYNEIGRAQRSNVLVENPMNKALA